MSASVRVRCAWRRRGAILRGSARLGMALRGSAWLGAALRDSARLGVALRDSARFSAARLGSAEFISLCLALCLGPQPVCGSACGTERSSGRRHAYLRHASRHAFACAIAARVRVPRACSHCRSAAVAVCGHTRVACIRPLQLPTALAFVSSFSGFPLVFPLALFPLPSS